MSKKEKRKCKNCGHLIYKTKAGGWEHVNNYNHRQYGRLCNEVDSFDAVCSCSTPREEGKSKHPPTEYNGCNCTYCEMRRQQRSEESENRTTHITPQAERPLIIGLNEETDEREGE